MIAEAEPVMRREFAIAVQAQHTWTDTFALWCLVRRPKMLERLQPIALAIAATYAAITKDAVRGARYPYHETPLVSASAQLAAGLLALGESLPLIAPLAAFVSSSAGDSGG